MAKCSPAGSTIPGVLFDGICREHGIEHLPTAPRSPTSTGKIERFHRSLRAEFLSDRRPFANLTVAQHALDAWAADCNTARTNHCTWPHPANDAPPRCPLDVRSSPRAEERRATSSWPDGPWLRRAPCALSGAPRRSGQATLRLPAGTEIGSLMVIETVSSISRRLQRCSISQMRGSIVRPNTRQCRRGRSALPNFGPGIVGYRQAVSNLADPGGEKSRSHRWRPRGDVRPAPRGGGGPGPSMSAAAAALATLVANFVPTVLAVADPKLGVGI